jgi:hypothetical protein
MNNLSSTIDYFKNQRNIDAYQDFRRTIDDSEYLTHLNFQDLKNLCQSDKSFKYICTNDTFRKIIYKKLNVLIPENIPIYNMLNNINHQIIDIIHDHFPSNDLPRYVNKELFYKDMLSDLWEGLANDLMAHIEDYHDGDKVDKRLYDIKKMRLSNYILVYPLKSAYEDLNDFKVPNTKIILPENFLKYAVLSLGSLEDFDFHDNFRIILKSLFIK